MPVEYHTGSFPPKQLDWTTLIPLIGPASAAIARYDGALAAIPNSAVLLAPLTTQEAVLSSRIEGTHATMSEALSLEAGVEDILPAERRDDIFEVLNYRRALNEAKRLMQDLPLSQRVIKAAHRILIEGVRGASKSPGEYRRIPVWIGPDRHNPDTARFIPINAGRLDEGMSEWEKYLHADVPDRLVQLAILHAEFEALHPFLDGNGRLGRMLVPLFLWQAKLIRDPMFYISSYFEARREAYYDGLLSVSRDRDWTSWCRFFLEALCAQADSNHARTMGILNLYNEMKPKTVDWTHSQYAVHALDWIFRRPIFKSTDFVANAGIPAPTAKRVLTVLREQGIFTVLSEGRGRRSSVFAFRELLNLTEGRDEF